VTIEQLRTTRSDLPTETPAATHAQLERVRRVLCDAALAAGHDPGRVDADVDAALDAALAGLSDARVHAYLGILAERAARQTLGLRSHRPSGRRPAYDATGARR
jgi:hypothetical protein